MASVVLVALPWVGSASGCGDVGSAAIRDQPMTWKVAESGEYVAGAVKSRGNARGAPVVLFFMGATTGSAVAFDLSVPGYSWMEHLVERGFQVFRWDPTGYGDSSRPPELDQPPERNDPISRSVNVAEQAAVVAASVLETTAASSLHVICWSAGCAPALRFAGEHPDQVRSLVVYAATFGPFSPLGLPPFDPASSPTNFLGAYRLTSHDDVAERWDSMIPTEDKADYRDPQVFEVWVRDFLASDPSAADRDPASVRVPNGMLADSYDLLLGHPPYDTGAVAAPALLVRGLDDPETNTRGSKLLLDGLGSSDKRLLEIPHGTHYLTVEVNHLALWTEVDAFLAAH